MSITIEQLEKLLDKRLGAFEDKFEKRLGAVESKMLTKDDAEKLMDKKLQPIHDKLSDISRDLNEIRRDLGYDNLRVIRKEEM
jgi:hypothetical protein